MFTFKMEQRPCLTVSSLLQSLMLTIMSSRWASPSLASTETVSYRDRWVARKLIQMKELVHTCRRRVIVKQIYGSNLRIKMSRIQVMISLNPKKTNQMPCMRTMAMSWQMSRIQTRYVMRTAVKSNIWPTPRAKEQQEFANFIVCVLISATKLSKRIAKVEKTLNVSLVEEI